MPKPTFDITVKVPDVFKQDLVNGICRANNYQERLNLPVDYNDPQTRAVYEKLYGTKLADQKKPNENYNETAVRIGWTPTALQPNPESKEAFALRYFEGVAKEHIGREKLVVHQEQKLREINDELTLNFPPTP